MPQAVHTPITSAGALSPGVLAYAQNLTDGRVTDAHLAQAASVLGVPLYAPPPSAEEQARAEAERAEWEAEITAKTARRALKEAREHYADARRRLGIANRTSIPATYYAPAARLSPGAVAHAKRTAMRAVNRTRAALRRAARVVAALLMAGEV